MKRHLILFSLLLIYSSITAQNIDFLKDKSWKEILNLAKEEKKVIFLDAYTTWCGPCKKMDKTVFTNLNVAKFYNKHFINIKMDMEKGEGVALAKKYKIKAYPTLIFIDADGEVVHRKAGFLDVHKFKKLGGEALSPVRNLGAMKRKFDKGNRQADFLFKYANASLEAVDGNHLPVAIAYMNTQKDWATIKNMEFIFQFTEDPDNPMFKYMVKNKEAFRDLVGSLVFDKKVNEIIYNHLYRGKALSLEDTKQLFYETFEGKQASKMYNNFLMGFYRQKGDRTGFAYAASEYIENHNDLDYGEINDIAWTFYEAMEDKVHLNKAVKWAKRSIKIKKRYENLDTLAHLYSKLGEKRKAKKTAKKAIKYAKKHDENPSSAKELLKTLKK